MKEISTSSTVNPTIIPNTHHLRKVVAVLVLGLKGSTSSFSATNIFTNFSLEVIF